MRDEKIRGIGRERDWRPVFQGIADGRGGFTVALGSNVQLRVKVQDFLIPQHHSHASAASEVRKFAERAGAHGQHRLPEVIA
jgi:hypothetical protein